VIQEVSGPLGRAERDAAPYTTQDMLKATLRLKRSIAGRRLGWRRVVIAVQRPRFRSPLGLEPGQSDISFSDLSQVVPAKAFRAGVVDRSPLQGVVGS
jgi:hypothetical protein